MGPDMGRYLPTRPAARRILALLLGVLPWVILELGLRWGVGPPRLPPDPFVEIAGERPLFVRNEARKRFEIAANRAPFFRPDSFAVDKSPREFRIFCLGGSTVQGNPYSIETSFTSWLQLSLRAAAPDRDWKVVNCGGISYASYRLAPILRECLTHQPDAIVLYVGDNEYLEDRTYQTVRQLPAWVSSSAARLGQFSVFQWARRGWLALGVTERSQLGAEVRARLDTRGGLDLYHRDDVWRAGVVEHYRISLRSMVEACQRAGVPVFLVDPVANVKDCPPFKTELAPGLSTAHRSEFEGLLAAAAKLPERAEDRQALLESALRIDARHAGALFLLGRSQLAQGNQEAWDTLVRAKDEDVCPLRLTEPLRQALRGVAEELGVPLVPGWREFCERSPAGIPGDEMLLDHVHPTISGQQILADLIFHEFQRRLPLAVVVDFESRRETFYREHLASLDAPYFARGQEHLQGLRRWAAGK